MADNKPKTLKMDPKSIEAHVAIHAKWAVVDKSTHSIKTSGVQAKDSFLVFEIEGTRPATAAEKALWHHLITPQADW